MARIEGQTGRNAQYWDYYLEVTEQDINIANNTSKVKVEVYLGATSYSRAVRGNIPATHTVTINGVDYEFETGAYTVEKNEEIMLGEVLSNPITHNEDGSKTISISAESPDLAQASGYGPYSGEASGDFVLTTIARASSVTCADGNIGSSTTININRASANFKHTLEYSFGSLSGTIVTKTSEASYGWNIPTSFYAQTPNSNSKQGTITCKTYNGDTLIGTKTCTFKAFVVNSNPTITATIVDDNSATKALTGDQNKLIKYFSNAKVTMTATPQNSATISSKKVTCGDGKSAITSPATLNGVESGEFSLSCFDSRGNQGTNTITKTMIEYIRLAFTNLLLQRPSSTSNNVNISLSGNYFNNSFGSVANTLTLKWRYREKNGTWSNYTTITPTKSGNTFSYSGTLGTNFNYRKEYEFEIVAQDKLITDTKLKNVTAGIPLIDIWKDNVGVNGNFNIGDIKALYEDINGVLATTTFKQVLDTITKGSNTYDITFKRSGNVVTVEVVANISGNTIGNDTLSNLDFPEWAKKYTETGVVQYTNGSSIKQDGYINFELRKTTSDILKYVLRADFNNDNSSSITFRTTMTYIIESE